MIDLEQYKELKKLYVDENDSYDTDSAEENIIHDLIVEVERLREREKDLLCEITDLKGGRHV